MQTSQKVGAVKKGISGSTLKLIALSTMLIDHIGAALLGRYLQRYADLINHNAGTAQQIAQWSGQWEQLQTLYWICRMVGRLSFPIFCFLLVEGFQKTGNPKKYALRLGIFALLSEVPFDLTFRAELWELSYQNVFFTLFLGLLTMLVCDKLEGKQWDETIKKVGCGVAIAAGAVAAELLRTDYGAAGVLCIMVLYLYRRNKKRQLLAGCVVFAWEITAPLAFLPIGLYNGERGIRLKYVFYLFYPMHLLVLYGVSILLGISSYPAL